MPHVVIVGDRESGKATFLSLLYATQVKSGSDASDAFRFHADVDSLDEISEAFEQLMSGNFPDSATKEGMRGVKFQRGDRMAGCRVPASHASPRGESVLRPAPRQESRSSRRVRGGPPRIEPPADDREDPGPRPRRIAVRETLVLLQLRSDGGRDREPWGEDPTSPHQRRGLGAGLLRGRIPRAPGTPLENRLGRDRVTRPPSRVLHADDNVVLSIKYGGKVMHSACPAHYSATAHEGRPPPWDRDTRPSSSTERWR